MARLSFLRFSLLAATICAAIAPIGAYAADKSLPEPIAAVVRGSTVASNDDSPSEVASYFSSAPIVIDEIPPYRWTGPHAAERWWMAVDAQNRKYGIPKLHFAMHPVKIWHIHGDVAYVVVPLTLSFTVRGQSGQVPGQWALTLQRLNAQWKITGAAWAEES